MKIDIKEISKIELKESEMLIVETAEEVSNFEYEVLRREIIRAFKKTGIKKPNILICSGLKFSKIAKEKK